MAESGSPPAGLLRLLRRKRFDACGVAGHQATETTTAAPAETTTLPPGATAGFDDLNQDGQPDPICRIQDFSAGLVLQIPCNGSDYASEPPEGVRYVAGSLYLLPGISDDLKSQLVGDVSVNAIQARDPAGKQVYVFFIRSDTLFDVGSSALSGPAKDALGPLARRLQGKWPTASIQVRGHTDSTGNAAANHTLSEQGGANVAAFLASQGIAQSRLSSVGLGASVPVAVEDNPAGQAENRRVELIVRVP